MSRPTLRKRLAARLPGRRKTLLLIALLAAICGHLLLAISPETPFDVAMHRAAIGMGLLLAAVFLVMISRIGK